MSAGQAVRRRHQLHDDGPGDVDHHRVAEPVAPVGDGRRRRVAVEPERRPEALEQPAVGREPDVIRVRLAVPHPARRGVAEDEDRRAPAAQPAQSRDREIRSDIQPGALLVARRPVLPEPGPFERRHGDALDLDELAARQRLGRVDQRLHPVAATVVVAADVRDLRPERVAQEAEIAGLEVAGADDRVDPADLLAVDRVVERRVDVVGDRQQADRRAVAALERARDPATRRSGFGSSVPAVVRGRGARGVLPRQLQARPLAAAGRADGTRCGDRRRQRADRLGPALAERDELDDVGIDRHLAAVQRERHPVVAVDDPVAVADT